MARQSPGIKKDRHVKGGGGYTHKKGASNHKSRDSGDRKEKLRLKLKVPESTCHHRVRAALTLALLTGQTSSARRQ
jgi:hypothetical protein